MSWSLGNSAAARLKDWLDPDNTGILVLNGWDPSMSAQDTIPPTQVTDLRATGKTSNSITLAWTAPADTSYGGIKRYEIRYATTQMSDSVTFATGKNVVFNDLPKLAGQTEHVKADSLAFGTIYYFALRAYDVWGNVSLISNVAKDTTWQAPMIKISPVEVGETLLPGQIKSDTITMSNVSITPSTLDYSISFENNTFPSGALTSLIVPFQMNSDKKIAGDKHLNDLNTGQALQGYGGPDLFGYKWIDSDEANGPQYVWNDISATGTEATTWTAAGGFGAKDDGYAGPFDLGFSFKFYGQQKTKVYIFSNGLILFNTPSSTYAMNAPITSSSAPNEFIAPFWDDLDGTTQGKVYYKTESNKFTIQFSNWQQYASGSATGSLTFQVVLFATGKIMFFYNTMTGEMNSATVGIENATGTTGLQLAYNAAFIKDKLAVKIAAEPDWVNGTNLNGQLNKGNVAGVVVNVQSQDFSQGNYSADMKIVSNDPKKPSVVVPITMRILDPNLPITVVSPNGKENWFTGTSNTISWIANGVTSFNLKFSTDDGVSWQSVAPTPVTGNNYNWVVPNAISSQCRVRVSSAAADSVFDISDGIFTISAPSTDCLNINLAAGWNMVSAPLRLTDTTALSLFPLATSPLYGFSNEYTPQTVLTPGAGYWVRYADSAVIPACGTLVSSPISLATGWNMIGIYNAPRTVGGITTTPEGIINSLFYGFSGNYEQASMLQPGKGYWVRASSPGVITVPIAGAAKQAIALAATIEKSWGTIAVTDNTGKSAVLYAADKASDFLGFDLPPVPPTGVFDVRYASQRMVETVESGKEIRISGAVYPVEIRADGMDITVTDKATGGKVVNHTLKSGTAFSIANGQITTIQVSSEAMPTRYMLAQSYPNPFNPTTIISYELPVNGHATLKVFDVLGGEVITLVNEEKAAGRYSATFNAARLSSGIYFYELKSQNFKAVKKMLLVK